MKKCNSQTIEEFLCELGKQVVNAINAAYLVNELDLQKGIPFVGGKSSNVPKSHKHAAPSRHIAKGNKPTCRVCGRHHEGRCDLWNCPGANRNTKLEWSASPEGIAAKAKGYDNLQIPANFKRPDKVSEDYFASLRGLDNEDLISVQIKTTNSNYVRESKALLDTGAVRGNYISLEIARELEQWGVKADPIHLVVYGGLTSSSSRSNKRFKLIIKYIDEFAQLRELTLEAAAIDIPIDLIIGRRTIKTEKLANYLPSQFTDSNDRDCKPSAIPDGNFGRLSTLVAIPEVERE